MTWESNINRDILIALIEEFGLKTFVETGTQSGVTALAVEPFFECVHTVEVGVVEHLRNAEYLRHCSRINCWFGDSPGFLAKHEDFFEKPVLFFLDAHWSGPATSMFETECPVMRELEAIAHLTDAVIIIDDARLFHGQELTPTHNPDQWPRYEHIEQWCQDHGRHLQQIGDQFIITPRPFAKVPTDVITKKYEWWPEQINRVLATMPRKA